MGGERADIPPQMGLVSMNLSKQVGARRNGRMRADLDKAVGFVEATSMRTPFRDRGWLWVSIALSLGRAD